MSDGRATQSRIASLIASFSVRAAGIDALHRRAEQPHAKHVERLPPHVFGAHVDDALEAEQRARRGAGDAVLPGAGLGDDARLAHALGEQRLAERVVDLVSAGVRQVFALQEDPRAAGRCRQALGLPQRRRAADVMRRAAASAPPRTTDPCGPANTRSRALRSAPRAFQGRSVRRTRRNSRARRDRAAQTNSSIRSSCLLRFLRRHAVSRAAVIECAQQSVVLDAGRRFDPRRDVDGERPHLLDRRPNVERRQSARQNHAPRSVR